MKFSACKLLEDKSPWRFGLTEDPVTLRFAVSDPFIGTLEFEAAPASAATLINSGMEAFVVPTCRFNCAGFVLEFTAPLIETTVGPILTVPERIDNTSVFCASD